MQKLNEKEWSHFLLPDIFPEIQRGKRLKNAGHISGDVPYVSSAEANNGVDDYIVASPGTRSFSDCISLANSGSVGTAFYVPFRYVASDHVTSLKRPGTSKFAYLFLTSSIKKQGSNFNFNREINDARAKRMQILLPIDSAGLLDCSYMEQYSSHVRRGHAHAI
ncbi:restriction endonuclease subunit S [Olsenella uli]